MSYCHKCGAKLEEDAKFCHVCGTPVGMPPAVTPVRRVRIPFFVSVIVLIAILVAGMFTALAFFPIHYVNFKDDREVPFEAGISALSLDFDADMAQVNISFENLTGRLVTLNVSATGGVGLLAPSNLLNVTFAYTSIGNMLSVTSGVHRVDGWPWSYWLNVVCDVRIDPSMSVNMVIVPRTGRIAMNTRVGAVFNSLILQTSTGGIMADLARGVVVGGSVVVRTTTGGIDFSWDNVNVTSNVLVDMRTTTGRTRINLAQDSALQGNITTNVESTTGGISYTIAIRDGVGARIESSSTVGGVSADKVGFSGTASLLQSSDYPAGSNFNVSLRTTTGHIYVNATFSP